jgi:hypothetical protein
MRKAVDFEKHLPSAKKYVDLQLAVMEKYGSRPVLTREKYESMIEEIAKIVARGALERPKT